MKKLLVILLICSIIGNIFLCCQLKEAKLVYYKQEEKISDLNAQINTSESLLSEIEQLVVDLDVTISELEETNIQLNAENTELQKHLEELSKQEESTVEDITGAYLVEKMPEKPAETPAQLSQPSSGGNLTKEDIISKLSSLEGVSGGLISGQTNGQASADSGYTGNVQLQ